MKIVILGAGAIGGGLGGLLARSGAQVELIARGEHLRALQRQGLTLATPAWTEQLQVPAWSHPREVTWGPEDVVLVCTKLYDAQEALESLRQATDHQPTVVCVFNGLDAGERMATARFSQVASAMVYLPATFLRPGRIELRGQPAPGLVALGAVPAGEPPEALAWLGQRMQEAGLVVDLRRDILPVRRAKLLTNLAGVAQALTLDDPALDWKALTRQARDEGKAVYRALGWDPDALLAELMSKVPEGFTRGQIDGQSRPGSSTWQSAARGRPTEARWLNGAIVELGRQAGVPTPINQDLVARAEARWPSGAIS